MGVKQWVRAMLVLSAMPSAVLALGLGEIRLNSSLNSPLDAEIELVNASAEELNSLRAQLASRETFARYGLEWPSFLSSVTLTRGKSRDGRDVLRVKSNESITEPFVTLLVDANWGRGRLVREYTMLLDPPVFAPAAPQSAAAPVAAPATSATRSGTVERAPAAAPAPAASGSDSDAYSVRRGDTLSAIAGRLASGEATREQAMVSLYRANPGAFEGSMNDLRAGAVLRVPQGGEWTSESPSAAAAEVRRQGAIWRGRAPAAASGAAPSGEGRLRLVAPTEPVTAGAAGAAGADAATRREMDSLRARLGELETELNNSKRLLELRNTELADLQRKLASATGAPAPVTPPAGVPAAVPEVEAPSAATPDETPATTPPLAADGSTAAEPADGAAAVVPEAEEKPAKPKREKPAKAADAEPGMLAGLLGALSQYWYVLVGLLAAVAAWFGYKKWQDGRDAALDDTFVNVEAAAAGIEMTQPVQPVRVPTGDTTKLRRPNIGNDDKSGLVVEESGEYQQPRIDAAAARSAPTVSAEDTFSGETGINLDQGDPLAEADFHMAYGLYDQAADLVRLAVAREPERRDLKLKLAEVFFVWGNKDEFLRTAQELRGAGDAGDWDKIVIMGKQIAPEDPMFAGAAMRSAADGSVDLRLEEGSGSIDFDVFGDGSGPTTVNPTATRTDFDLGTPDMSATLADTEATGERLSFDAGPTAEVATVKMDAGGGTTREMVPQFGAKPADQSLDFDLGADLSEDVGEAPTVEQPALRGGSPTIRAKLDAALRQTPAAEQTAEIALDDLGLDLQGTGNFDQGDYPVEEQGNPDAPTLVANLDATGIDLGDDLGALTDLDDTSRRMIDAATKQTEILPRSASFDTAATAAMERLPDSAAGRGRDSGATSMMAAFDINKFESSLDLSSIEDTGTHQSPGGLDLDVGSSTMSGARMPQVAADGPGSDDDLTLPSLEPVTISEVGTKLDLARAYMDMGDPDGARSILREVLQEGSVSQKQEAERLMGSLPG